MTFFIFLNIKMDYYVSNLIEIIEKGINYPIKYVNCDMYTNDFLDIDIDILSEEIAKKLNCKINDNIINYNNYKIKIIQTINNDNWINYNYEIIYL